MGYYSPAVTLISGILEQGLLTRDLLMLRVHYLSTIGFRFDVISILPTDIFYAVPPPTAGRPYLRFNRLLRIRRLMEFFDRTDTRTSRPIAFRLVKLLTYVVVLIHWNACLYIQISRWIGFGADEWVYPPASNWQVGMHLSSASQSSSLARNVCDQSTGIFTFFAIALFITMFLSDLYRSIQYRLISVRFNVELAMN